ncbi:MAG: LpxL/LpxP family Kdo(2)-lipid IV(A) lauroyl/palmitoleoyl acyltransferase [Oleiphilaceae bacterium]|nr:LpxL/LpxP family Kdo(2)-lipid IV(A) lauroyl/palmitoleoyl acyltransferase [Oleiphilaceae bacterium]
MQNLKPEHRYSNFLKPKFWPTWLLIGLMRLLARLPHGSRMGLGRFLGHRLYKLKGSRYKTARGNINACFPELSEEEREQLVYDTFISNATGYMESLASWWGNYTPYIDKLTVHGIENLKEAQERGKGILLVGGHFSMLDLAGPLLNSVTQFGYMYRPQNNPLLDAAIERARLVYNARPYSKRQVKDMIEDIKAGALVWYAPDQDMGKKQSVFAPFFGVPASSITTTAWIARETGCTVLRLAQYREDNDGHYSLYFGKPYENFPSDDEVENATIINKGLEEDIRRHKEQYLWLHRRFKTRPDGEPSLY